ncbi:unnamed protein product, partial [Medioppia subpectinata]
MSSLLNSWWSFAKRHRNKALVGVGVVGAFYALNRYVHSVANEWQNSSSRDFVSEVKKKEIHFENTIDTCNQTSMSLSVKIVDILDQSLDAEPILEAIRADKLNDGGRQSIALWNKLKVRIFTRVIAEVYCVVLFVTYLRVQLSVLAGYIYVDNCANNPANLMSQIQATSSGVQNKYLSLLHNFYTEGIQQIIEPIMEAVEDALQDISLKDKIVLQDLKNIFDKEKLKKLFAAKRETIKEDVTVEFDDLVFDPKSLPEFPDLFEFYKTILDEIPLIFFNDLSQIKRFANNCVQQSIESRSEQKKPTVGDQLPSTLAPTLPPPTTSSSLYTPPEYSLPTCAQTLFSMSPNVKDLPKPDFSLLTSKDNTMNALPLKPAEPAVTSALELTFPRNPSPIPIYSQLPNTSADTLLNTCSRMNGIQSSNGK